MKDLIIALTIILLVVLLAQIVLAKTILRTEKQNYTVIEKDRKIEIRKYSKAIFASITMKGQYNDMATNGFRVLVSYIFGNNHSNSKIKMTAPVRMLLDDSTTMSFVIPSKYNDINELPEPANSSIVIHPVNEVFTASLRFGGYANDKRINRKIEKLKSILNEKGISHKNDFQFLG